MEMLRISKKKPFKEGYHGAKLISSGWKRKTIKKNVAKCLFCKKI